MRRACEACGRSFQAKNDRHRFCSASCRQRGHRGASVVPLDGAGEQGVEAATRARLEDAGRVSSPEGMSALLLARKLDQGGDTGSAMAALAKQHLSSLEAALRDVEVAGDPVDELRSRRQRRLSASG